MSQILIIEPEERVRDLFSVHLTSELGAEVFATSDATDGIGMLDLFEDVAAVVTKNQIGNEQTAKEVIRYIETRSRSKNVIPIFIVGDFELPPEKENIYLLPETIRAKQLAETVSKICSASLDESNGDESNENKSEYAPVPISLFCYFHQTPADIFIKIKKSETTEFLIRFKKDSTFEESQIRSYQEKGAKFLYVKTAQSKEFLSFVNTRFIELMENEHGSLSSKEDIQTFVLNQVSDLGLSEESVTLAIKTVDNFQQKLDSAKGLGDLLKNIYKSDYNYRYRNSLTISVLAYQLIKALDWGEKRHEQYIATAAFFHDMELNEDEQMSILSQEELNANLNQAENSPLIEKHAKLAAENLEKFDDIPSEVIKIVRQHHGHLAGVGFETSPPKGMSPLSYIFILCEEFSCRLLTAERKELSISSLLNEIRKKYRHCQEIREYSEILKQAFQPK
jgi:HD-GYP domain-containing protein (c-di-GMP phosphodiesterase class II)